VPELSGHDGGTADDRTNRGFAEDRPECRAVLALEDLRPLKPVDNALVNVLGAALLVPGLLQSEAYARAVFWAYQTNPVDQRAPHAVEEIACIQGLVEALRDIVGRFATSCLACGAESEAADNDRLPVEVWALKHTGLNPTHRQYQPKILSFWRVDPAPGNPYLEPQARGSVQR
jgi:hypothetical protein